MAKNEAGEKRDALGGNRSLLDALSIEIVEATPEKVVATMPVTDAVRQPFGLLHGGASVALAETVASIGALYNIDQERQVAVGLEINANHVRGKKEGVVTAVGTPLHRGKSTMVWDIKVMDEEHKLICVSRCTMAILEKPRETND